METITLDCQTKMANIFCEDCLARKDCKIHEAIKNMDDAPKDNVHKATAEQDYGRSTMA